jgi:aspartate racemase
MKRIGVLGGVGPQATMDFEARLHAAAQALEVGFANEAYPPLLAYYHRQPPIATGVDGLPLEPPRIGEEFLEAARYLGAWADVLVVTSNGMHVFQEEIEQASGRPVLSMVETTVDHLVARGVARAGAVTLNGNYAYAEPLAARGIACETIGPELQAPINQAAFAVMAGRVTDGDREALGAALRELRARGVECIILGCTELPFLVTGALAGDDLVNPLALLAEAAVRYVREPEPALTR